VNLIAATSFGSTQCGFSFVFGFGSNGQSRVSSGFSSRITRVSSFSLNPVPVWPA